VSLENTEGRGEIRIVEQPSESNGYATRLRIRDPQSGAGEYAFKITWTTPSNSSSEPLSAQTGLTWSGVVDGDVRVTVSGGVAFSEVIRGQPVGSEHARFELPLPSRSGLKPVIRKLEGRGTVSVVEYPTQSNGYRLVFEIQNAGSGADMYKIEVAW
jgi:hypothetical protein